MGARTQTAIRREAPATSWGITARALRLVAVAIRVAGADPNAIFAEAGVDTTLVHDADGRITHETFFNVLRLAMDKSRDRYFGFRLASIFDPRIFESTRDVTEFVVLQAFAHSATLGEGLRRWARYYPLADDQARWSLERSGTHAIFGLLVPSGAPDLYVEFLLSNIARAITATSEASTACVEIRLRHAAPSDSAIAERLVGLPLRFGAAANAVVIRWSALGSVLRPARPKLLRLVERRANDALDRLQRGNTLVAQARAIITAKLGDADATADGVAKELGVSVRTLSRRLAEADTSHRALLDEVRADLARQHVGHRSARDVATLLGFSDTSTYRRAFRRWFGCTPRELTEKNVGRTRHAR